jgi:pyruvate/2-oxoglutarate dehydrogenase complex dihydrolipoamide acyltransferase (E2) component
MTNVFIPKSGVEEGEAVLETWQRNTGDYVSEGDVLAIVTTDKIEIEIVASASGYLRIIMPEASETRMTAVIGVIEENAPADS